MRIIIILSFLLSFLTSVGQWSTRKREEGVEIFKDNSLVTDKIKGKYSNFILYSNNCLDYKKHIVYTLGLKGDKWELIKWKCRYLYKDLRMDPYKVKITRKRMIVRKENVDSILWAFKQLGFWELNNDSINNRGQKIINGKLYEINAFTCGPFCTDLFEFHEDGQAKTVAAFEVDGWQKLAPVWQRQKFIICRNKFLKIIK